jgi:HNH endonuclease
VAVDRRGIRHGRGRSASTSAIAQQPVCAFDGCRARFEPVQPTQRYCGPPCRQRAKNRTVAQRRRDGVYTKNGGRRRLGVSDAERKLSAAYRRVLRADPCAYCGEPGGALDHVEPRHLGGADDWTNLAGVCGSCNSAKTLGLLDFLLTQRHRESIAPVVEQIERMGRGRASLRV